jgi:Fic family protein
MDKIRNLETLVDRYKQSRNEQVDASKLMTYALTYYSMALAGSILTHNQVRNLLGSNRPAPGKSPAEQQAVIDHQQALLFTLQAARERAPLTETLIRQIGALVLQSTGHVYNTAFGTCNSAHGDYRLLNVSAEARRFPDSATVPDLVKALVNDVNYQIEHVQTFEQKCELAFELHYRLAVIHPFADGNGRTGRLLMNYILSRFDLSPFCVIKKHRIRYILALEKARILQNGRIFYDVMYTQYQKFLEKELKTAGGNASGGISVE